ncbi:Pleckstrin homology domain-containing protein [Mycena pura]|uniref:Pleckstrin homology domain-containing protein n=1 Tax=Mycena pura TaxID=153505 RepID=A0AAD6VGP1_9AGAR|nr:Pleckstrin homology domain-containing protein [Mycena pura]
MPPTTLPSIIEPSPLPLGQSGSASGNNLKAFKVAEHALHERIFVGPLQEKVVTQLDAVQVKRKQRRFRIGSVDEGEGNIPQIIKDHAFAFFIQHGGNEEDWGDTNEQSVREEMLRRWRETEWGTIWGHRKQNKEQKQPNKWIGGSFVVGDIVGVNILQEPAESIRERLSIRSARSSRKTGASNLPASIDERPTATNEGVTSFYAARDAIESTLRPQESSLRPPASNGVEEDARRTQSDYFLRPHLDTSSPVVKSDSHVPGISKQLAVHYADREETEASPAPPSEVLERSLSEIPETSAEATVATGPTHTEWEDFVMRDRMLVKVGYTKDEAMGPVFDEETSRKTRGMRYDEWAEFIVYWRNNVIHFYEPHNIPGTKWLSGSKYRLAHIVPLKSTKTRLSLYYFADLTFCLTCPPSAYHKKSRTMFHRSKDGTNVFICKVKSRSRAADWMWSVWRRLGGSMPQTIEVRNPILDARVKIEMPGPQFPGQAAPEMFTRDNIVALCMRSLRRVKDWKELIEMHLAQGRHLELAWRLGTQLDWVWLETDVLGEPRNCAVLYGLAMQQSHPSPHLEIRLGQHCPQHFVHKDGSRVTEPPAIEGYIERVRPNAQSKYLMYLVAHDGNLFSLSPEHAHPPTPMGMNPAVDTVEGLRFAEVQRGILQILHATGVADMRAILTVRRAFQPVVPASHDSPELDDHSHVEQASPVERTESDDEDEGGEEGLRAAQDKQHLKMRRSFELLLKNGHVIRFEAHSRKVALEWIERLRVLVSYWKERHRIDASEEMDLAQTYRPRLTPRRHVLRNDSELPPEAPVDASAPLPALSNIYNWCALEGCRPIIRGGKLFMRHGLYGQYKFVQLFLLPGHLVQFRITPQSSLHLAMRKNINLADAYVCSGFFAASTLPSGQYVVDNVLPRRYQDGLETDDPDEDTLFMLWYHPHRAAVNMALEMPDEEEKSKQQTDSPRTPSLSAKRKVAVFRCRNKLERDAWCWALNCEIEKIVRIQKHREEKLRNTGGGL